MRNARRTRTRVNKRCMSVVGSGGLSEIIEAENEDVAYGKKQEVKFEVFHEEGG